MRDHTCTHTTPVGGSHCRRPLDEGDVLEERVTDKEGIKYYEWCEQLLGGSRRGRGLLDCGLQACWRAVALTQLQLSAANAVLR